MENGATQSGALPPSTEPVKKVKLDNGSIFGHLDLCPPDAIFRVKEEFLADKSPNKVNLGVGGESN